MLKLIYFFASVKSKWNFKDRYAFWPILSISAMITMIMPRCACASEVYGNVSVCVCLGCSGINEVQVRVSIGF